MTNGYHGALGWWQMTDKFDVNGDNTGIKLGIPLFWINKGRVELEKLGEVARWMKWWVAGRLNGDE